MAEKIPIPYTGSEKYVFVSYSHQDKDLVYKDLNRLIESGIRIWYDKGIPAGPEWDEFVYPKIVCEQCALVLFYVSEHFFYSDAIAKEIKIVFNTSGTEKEVKNSFSVNIGGISAMNMWVKSENRFNFKEENIKLMLDYFGEKRIYIKHSTINDNHINEILEQLLKYDVIDERYKYKIKKNDRLYDILFIAKESTFTNSLHQGIISTYSKMPDVNFNSVLINNGNKDSADDEVIKYIEKNEKLIDGLLLRPINDISRRLILKLESLIAAGKKVILLDKDLNDSQKKSFKYSLPLFVGSDFNYGGRLIGERINTYLDTLNEDYKIFILDGPKSFLSADQRVTALKEVLNKTNRDIHTTSFIINSFDVNENIAFLEDKLHALYVNDRHILCNYHLVFYFGNDNIAKKAIQLFMHNEESYITKYIKAAKSVLFVGYDGIIDINGDIDLLNLNVNAMTVDVMPIVQGNQAAKKMIQILTDAQEELPLLLRPQLKENINLQVKKVKSIDSIKGFIETRKLLIFDLDGTIANTEVFHFKSYQIILKNYNIDFELNDFRKYIGNSEINIWNMLKIDYNLDFDVAEMLELRTKIVLELFEKEDIKPFAHFRRIINDYPNIEKVILSSQIPLVINYLLERWNLLDEFSDGKIVSVSSGKCTKEEVLRNIGEFYKLKEDYYDNTKILLFEDSAKVLSLARKLNIDSIGIEHVFNCNKLSNCNYIINEEIASGLFIGLAGIDIVHYQNEKLPEENQKSKTNDFEVYVGGPAANAAITFANLGGYATLVSCIGNSGMGKALKGMLKKYNVNVIDAISDDKYTPNISSVIVNLQNGNRTIISGQRIANDVDFVISKKIIDEVDIVLYDCNAPKLFNANISNLKDKDLILDAGSFKPHIYDALNLATEVISSSKFKVDGKTILEAMDEYGINFAAITNGENPIYYKDDKGHIGEIEVEKMDNVIDTLGAGDVLHGAYCYFRIGEKCDYVSSLKKASVVASLSVTHRGIIKK